MRPRKIFAASTDGAVYLKERVPLILDHTYPSSSDLPSLVHACTCKSIAYWEYRTDTKEAMIYCSMKI